MSSSVENTHPKFAVVGHPNKGKSTIVSSLAFDSSVQISNTPGTTTSYRSFPLKVDGVVLYELYDTPGFQRARVVLAWLEKHKDVPASKRKGILQDFVSAHESDEHFSDEVALLKPILQGAGILYVVDASKPYSMEFEAEMEILRWSGQPSMAILNHIGTEDYSMEWKHALSQYFRLVRTFDPMNKNPKQHIALLESMAQLSEAWVESMKRSIALFKAYQQGLLKQSADIITQVLLTAIEHKEKLNIHGEEASKDEELNVETQYKERLRAFEQKAQKRLELIWKHQEVVKKNNELPLAELDLFSEESAFIFGLTRQELLITGATSGAIAGAAIDLATVGHTLILGGIIGGAVGAVGAYFGFEKLSEFKVLGVSLGTHTLQIGPMQNRNFPYILLGRLLYHTKELAMLSHANKQSSLESMNEGFKEEWLEDSLRAKLEKYHKKMRKERIDNEEVEAYTLLIEEVLAKLVA